MESLESLFGRDYPADEREVVLFVQRAIVGKSNGDSMAYQQICDMIKNGNTGPVPRKLQLIKSLSKCTASFTRDHHSVVSILLNNCWRDGDAVVDAAEVFAVNCVSVNAELVPSCINALVKQFLEIPLTPNRRAGSPGGDDESLVMSDGVHKVLSRVIETFPTGTTTLLTQLKERFPHKRRDVLIQQCFLENALRVLDYVPQIMAPLLDEVVDRLVQIDVEIIVEDFVEGDADGEGGDGVFDMELADTAKGVERKEKMEKVEKLDAMMLITLDFLNAVFSSSKSVVDRDALFQTLLDIFEKRVLTTFRSKYTQFLIFYASHFRTRYIQSFLSQLLKITTGTNHPDATLLAASCYCGSFLARAGFSRLPLTATALRLLAIWLHEYIDVHDTDPDPATHSHFYAVAQSFMYALCFKLRSLMSETKLETMVKLELRLDRIITCKLNPLKVVGQPVAEQFIKIAVQCQALQKTLINPIIKRNANIYVRGVDELSEEMSFFPFDPYLLAASKIHIDAIYQDWEGHADSDEEDDEWANGIGSNSERSASASASSRHHSMIEESMAMSLSSQLSLSDVHSDGNHSPSWRPMSFSPPRDHHGLKLAVQQQGVQRRAGIGQNVQRISVESSSNTPPAPETTIVSQVDVFPSAGAATTSLSIPVPNGVTGSNLTPNSKRKRNKRDDD